MIVNYPSPITHCDYVVTDQELIFSVYHQDGLKRDLAIPTHAKIVKRYSDYNFAPTGNPSEPYSIVGFEYSGKYLCPLSNQVIDFQVQLPLSLRKYFDRLQWFLWQYLVVLPSSNDPRYIEEILSNTGWWNPSPNNAFNVSDREEYLRDFDIEL